jgi:hypothetical protein
MEAHLSSRHRDTIEKIFTHPPNRNIEWREVVSLLETAGTVTQEHNGKLRVALGPETEVLPAPHGKDVDVQILVDLRRMLEQGGFGPDGSPATADQTDRDHGDGQWGEPTT